jgi:DNA-binding response OmpR family regulator
MVVDDDDDIRGGLRALFEAEGFTVLEAPNGRDALALLVATQSSKPTLILLDLQMPIMSGREFLGLIERYVRLAAIPVVISSGLPPDPQMLRRPGVAAWSRKPCDPNELVGLVRAHARDPELGHAESELRVRRLAR